MAVSCMHNASGYNYRNSSFIVDKAIWGRYHVPQNAILYSVSIISICPFVTLFVIYSTCLAMLSVLLSM